MTIEENQQEVEASEWRPISEWAKIPRSKRPKLAIFRYAPTEPNRTYGSYLSETYEMQYPYGSRVCTHFKSIKEFEE